MSVGNIIDQLISNKVKDVQIETKQVHWQASTSGIYNQNVTFMKVNNLCVIEIAPFSIPPIPVNDKSFIIIYYDL